MPTPDNKQTRKETLKKKKQLIESLAVSNCYLGENILIKVVSPRKHKAQSVVSPNLIFWTNQKAVYTGTHSPQHACVHTHTSVQ